MERTPQQLMYDEVVRAMAVPLKGRGFLKRGDRFGLRSGDNWGVIDLQKDSRATTRTNIEFVINLGVWLRTLEDEPRDSPPAISDCHWWERARTERPILGEWPPPREKWWIIDDESVPGFLPPLVTAAVAGAIPVITEHLEEGRISSLYRAGRLSGLQLARRHRARLDGWVIRSADPDAHVREADLTNEERDVLLSALKWSTLWEVITSVQKVSPENATNGTNDMQTRARQIVIGLARRGWLEPYRATVLGFSMSNFKAVPLPEFEGALADRLSWRTPQEREAMEFEQYGVGPSASTYALVDARMINGARGRGLRPKD
jgi:hypothetical protein